jgi:hypothetical protein
VLAILRILMLSIFLKIFDLISFITIQLPLIVILWSSFLASHKNSIGVPKNISSAEVFGDQINFVKGAQEQKWENHLAQ